MENPDILSAFSTWQFAAACVAVASVMVTLGKAGRQAAPGLYSRGWVKSLMTLGNLFLGLAAAVPKGFLMGDSFGQRAFVGLCAGGMSNIVYHTVLKRMKFFGGGGVEGKEEQEKTAPPAPPVP